MRTFGILAWSLILFSAPAMAQSTGDQGWSSYNDPNVRMQLSYPTAVFRPDHAKTSPAGRVFVTADGNARLLIGELENVDRHTPATYQKFISAESYSGAMFDYKPVGGSWTVLSGTRGDTMFYQKVVFSCDARLISTFAITYPTRERAFFDPIVERIEDSFKPGLRCDRTTLSQDEQASEEVGE